MPSNRTINIYRPYDAYIVSRGQPPRGILLPWFPQSRRGISSLIRGRARFHLSFLLIFAKLQARRQSDMIVWRKAVARNRTPCVSLRNLSARGTHTYRCLVSEGAETEQADIDPATGPGYIMQKIADERNLGKMRIGIGEGSKSGYQNNVVKSYPPSHVWKRYEANCLCQQFHFIFEKLISFLGRTQILNICLRMFKNSKPLEWKSNENTLRACLIILILVTCPRY